LFLPDNSNSLYNNSIKFEKGVQKTIGLCADEVQVLFVANLVDCFSVSKPNLFTYIKAYTAKQLNNNAVETEYNTFYNSVLSIQKTKTS